MVGFVRKQIKNMADQDAEDFVQEVALNLYQRADIAAPIENLSAYIYRALRNDIVDYLRARKDNLSLDQPVNSEGTNLLDIVKLMKNKGSFGPARKEIEEELYLCLNRLTKEERAIIIATDIEGYTCRELSERWQIPINTLLSKKSRTMKKLIHKAQNTPK